MAARKQEIYVTQEICVLPRRDTESVRLRRQGMYAAHVCPRASAHRSTDACMHAYTHARDQPASTPSLYSKWRAGAINRVLWTTLATHTHTRTRTRTRTHAHTHTHARTHARTRARPRARARTHTHTLTHTHLHTHTYTHTHTLTNTREPDPSAGSCGRRNGLFFIKTEQRSALCKTVKNGS
jgi:hypothetical protein